MKSVFQMKGLMILLVAALFIVPTAHAASTSKDTTTPQDQIAVPAEKSYTPAKPLMRTLKVNPGAGGPGEKLPVPNDSAVGISLPGSESSALTVGSPGDKHEQEADDVADRIMSNPKPKTARGLSLGDDVGRKPDVNPAGPVSNLGTPGADVGLDPRDDPAGPVSTPQQ